MQNSIPIPAAQWITMSDHVDIATYHFGNPQKPCLIILPSLTGTVDSYMPIISNPYLLNQFYIVFMDYRAHLDKEKNVTQGMSIARLSCDLYEVINQLKCDQVTLLGHSIGCSVIWSYIELYNQFRVKSLILLDQSPAIMSLCYCKEGFEQDWYLMSVEQFQQFTYQITQPDLFHKIFKQHFDHGFVSEEAKNKGVLNQWLSHLTSMDPRNLARLMIDTLTRDWRDMLHTIKVPTLVVGSKASIAPWQIQQWVAQQIPNATLKLIEKDQGGYHAMFLEQQGSKILNETIDEFLQDMYQL